MVRADYEICAYQYTWLFLSLFINTAFLTQDFSCFPYGISFLFFSPRQMEVRLTSFKNCLRVRIGSFKM
jgi:hypothetical protein